MANTERSVIFGGKTNFIKRCLNKISKEEFLKKRFLPIYSVGEANYKGNRLFEIKDKTEILFKPDKKQPHNSKSQRHRQKPYENAVYPQRTTVYKKRFR